MKVGEVNYIKFHEGEIIGIMKWLTANFNEQLHKTAMKLPEIYNDDFSLDLPDRLIMLN
jgi:hypothetical protein